MKNLLSIGVQCWEWFAQHLYHLLSLFACIQLAALMLVTCIDVVGRYLFSSPLVGSVELTEILLGSLIFTSLPLVTWRKEHISVDLMEGMLPKQIRSLRDILFNLAVSISLFAIGTKVWSLAARSHRYEEVSEYLEIPVYYLTYFLAITCWLTSVTCLVLIGTHLLNKNYPTQGTSQ
ncbi:TRAP transporter small permease [Vibrio hangzhouensis]|uniref:TRAP transporter small permease n=1 Tax=Vibrio hangzhouensis TaxID=462991 RepID=UPI001C95B409|nr:TRAP transporter small permease [Vibrio hangzhouensis]MBY6198147.1 TRAP transporter small permease [Vibrio hangzhouensis]